MKRKLRMTFLLLSFMVLLAGCSQTSGGEEREDNVYTIYYLNGSMTKLIPQEYETETTDADELVEELMYQLIHVPKNLDCQSAISDKVGFKGHKREQMVLYLYFDNSYNSMGSTQEILCRAALAKTMTQIEGIDFINLYAGEQPIMDINGNPIGMFSNSDFIESISDVNAFEKVELTLFFADETGEKLVQEKREVVHNINTSVEKLILKELIEGPKSPGMGPTLSSDIKVLNVSVNENVCYLNLDSTFLSVPLQVQDYIPIYSIVNSLSELSTVNKVQISVEGSQDIMFRDTISLNTLFERNLDYVE